MARESQIEMSVALFCWIVFMSGKWYKGDYGFIFPE